ncbi:hypothetical protein HYH03_013972 [Edaphochlamys debaryana]|uniref:Uncharacterized protein n=1 Tax=Edaphochlamys debaryana TaxID=47281 RepID=A0A835XR24_9CHLO|nr:hypothetical protein HYH03_013972 [Edaphochlamys debaryana]|eukprot:KAG2487403.1 hypothetical protein HYH03_013972 [Edaphochlamys debaryana]
MFAPSQNTVVPYPVAAPAQTVGAYPQPAMAAGGPVYQQMQQMQAPAPGYGYQQMPQMAPMPQYAAPMQQVPMNTPMAVMQAQMVPMAAQPKAPEPEATAWEGAINVCMGPCCCDNKYTVTNHKIEMVETTGCCATQTDVYPMNTLRDVKVTTDCCTATVTFVANGQPRSIEGCGAPAKDSIQALFQRALDAGPGEHCD